MTVLVANHRFWIVALAGWLCACSKLENRVIATVTVTTRPVESERAELRFAYVPDNPLVVIRQPAGFSSGQDMVQAYEHVSIEIEVTNSVGKIERFELGRSFSSNAGAYSSRRNDGSWDYGGRLVLGGITNGVMMLRIHDVKSTLRYPLVIELQKLNEMPL